MNLLRIIYISALVMMLSGCLSTELEESRTVLAAEEYEAYLKNAVYGNMKTEGEDPFQTRQRHIEYYTVVTGDREVAKLIYDESCKYNIDPDLAFALAFSESSFRRYAVNENRNSIDRGIFQLNSRSFPNLKESDFFNPEINIPLGVAYLRYCLDIGGNEVAALAMYNAGPNRVKDNRTPNMTLDYIAKIQDYKGHLEQGLIPEDFTPGIIPVPDVKSLKNITLLMEQSGKIN